MGSDLEAPLFLIYVVRAVNGCNCKEAVCWVHDKEEEVQAGVNALTRRFGDNKDHLRIVDHLPDTGVTHYVWNSTFCFESVESMDSEEIHSMNLSLQDATANKEYKSEYVPWMAWQAACWIIWPNRCLFWPKAFHDLRTAVQDERTPREQANHHESEAEQQTKAKTVSSSDTKAIHTRGEGDTHTEPSEDPYAPYMPARWFTTEHGIPADRLYSARKNERISAKRISSDSAKRPTYHFSVPDAKKLWPEDFVSSQRTAE